MPGPEAYADRYLSLTVGFDDGASKLVVSKYHEGAWDKDADRLIDSAVEDFTAQKKKDPRYSLTLNVNGKPVVFSDLNVLRRSLQYAFEGKGSPEDCQVAAQMAVLRKKTTKAGLQSYCDAGGDTGRMGLDCTGFVGNYLWYVQGISGAKTWPGANSVAADGMIDDILFKTTPVTSLDSLNPGNLHVMGLLDSSNRVVARDSAAAHAHIVISQPGKSTTDMGILLGTIPFVDSIDVGGNPCLWVIESTSKLGLTRSWYVLTEVLDSKKKIKSVTGKPSFKVFNVYRGSKREWKNFTIGSLKPSAT